MEASGNQYVIYPREGKALFGEVTALAKQRGWPLTGLRLIEGRLDEVFRSLTAGEEQIRKAH